MDTVKSYILSVTVPENIFEAYWYGVGEVIYKRASVDHPDRYDYVVDYGDDEYRANYQAGRFASGLHFAKVDYVEFYLTRD